MKRLTKEKEIREAIQAEHDRTGGIFCLKPCWVGRPQIIVPGRRIKLLDDYMSQDVVVNERWLSSVTYADNGVYNKVCPEDHGLSYIVIGDSLIMLKNAVEVCKDLLLGPNHKWDILPKFFDNWGRIPNHIHPCDHHVAPGLLGKPESYFFPVELNISRNSFPCTYFGVDPAYTGKDILKYLKGYFKGNNDISHLSNGINLTPGTGWYLPPCTLHAPGSLVTYEVQTASDVSCIPESRVNDTVMPPDLLDRDLPVKVATDGEDKVFEYILDMIKCPGSGNFHNFRKEYYRIPVTIANENGNRQDFVMYGCGKTSDKIKPDLYSAKNTVIAGRQSWRINEQAPFGFILLSGYGKISVPGKKPVEIAATSVYHTRDEMGADELFISQPAAEKLELTCSSMERMSFYQHFPSNSNPEAAKM